MAQKRSKVSRFKSPSTGEYCDTAQYAAEIMCQRKCEKDNEGSLAYKFWNKKQNRSYQAQIVAARKLIKEFGEDALIKYINSPRGKNTYSLGFFNPRPFVKKVVAFMRHLLDQQPKPEENIVKQIDNTSKPRKAFGQKSLFSKIKKAERSDDDCGKK